MPGHQPDQHQIPQIAPLSASPRDIFHLNPPQSFAYTDFVIKAPLPQLPDGMPAETARRKYPRTRLKRLIRAVEARLGGRRCFFSELQPKDRKQESQFEFVMANIERDAMRNEYGPTVKLTLPILPASAVPIYQEMLRQERRGSARMDANLGHITGVAFNGEIHTCPAGDSRIQALSDGSSQQHGLMRTSFMPLLSSSPNIRDALFEHSREELEELVRNDLLFRSACEYHHRLVQKDLRQMYRCYLRYVGRQPGMHLWTWLEVTHEARRLIKMTFIQQLKNWMQQQPGIKFDFQDVTGTVLDLQLRYLTSQARHFDPIPTQASPQFQTELHRQHVIAAMLRQRRILREWTTSIARRSSVRDGERYRREGEHILDMWTGTVEEYEAFKERNRKENTVITAGMLPMATQLRVRAPRAQVQSHARVHEKQQSPDGAQRPLHVQEQAQVPMPAQGQEQPDTDLGADACARTGPGAGGACGGSARARPNPRTRLVARARAVADRRSNARATPGAVATTRGATNISCTRADATSGDEGIGHTIATTNGR
ncbi:uncharacterized protein Z519_03198 [Cladophialophora bantiana CBS 173.52]|uniref:Uncharacterized protein n=1 Tax=Cladophialophora bantiana (strain ATCC 10958 / CBS 173.52 / CDC B-1940 / NIH 8579) TaxID=1442370 RepID=A0A0D2F1Q2_CLAB1|nr:uncharacterized protein Z519_03198 [Cladophialophora bantiana CBS 173.52]KIW96131.1 hypothetical protein Z519_03198 [Cladophialophora bantiana CBS 173.52]